jgi:hypothetical protein
MGLADDAIRYARQVGLIGPVAWDSGDRAFAQCPSGDLPVTRGTPRLPPADICYARRLLQSLDFWDELRMNR